MTCKIYEIMQKNASQVLVDFHILCSFQKKPVQDLAYSKCGNMSKVMPEYLDLILVNVRCNIYEKSREYITFLIFNCKITTLVVSAQLSETKV